MERLRNEVGPYALAMVVGLMLTAHRASGEPAMSLHFGPVTYPACEALDTESLTCGDIVVEGRPRQEQRVYVLSSDVAELNAVEFGISYPPSVHVLYWQPCWSALAISESGWPVSDTGIALSWGDGLSAAGADDMIVLGFFELEAGSRGVMSLTVDPRTGSATYLGSDAVTRTFDPARLGRADAGGAGGGVTHCGGRMGWDGPISAGESGSDEGMGALEMRVLESATAYTASQRTNVLDCGSFGIAHEPSVWTTDVELGANDADDTPHTLRTISDGAGNDEPVMYALNWDIMTSQSRVGMMRTRTNGQLRYADELDDVQDPVVPRGAYLPRRHFMEVDGPNGRIYYVAEDNTPEGVRLIVSAVRSIEPGVNIWRYLYHNALVDGDDFVGGMGVRNDTLFVGGYAVSGANTRPFAFALNASTGDSLAAFTYPFPNHEADVRDVALDPRPGGPFWLMGASATLSMPPQGIVRLALDPTTLVLTPGSVLYGAPDASLYPELMAVGTGGDVAIAGVVSNASHTGDYDLFVLSLRAPGEESAYVRYQDGWADVQTTDLIVGAAGDVYLLGGVFPSPEPPSPKELAVLRVNPDGGIQWDSRITCLADADRVEGGALAERDLLILLAAGMFAPNSSTLCENRSCVNLLGFRRDSGELFWHGLDVEASAYREPVVLATGHDVDGAFRVYAGGVFPRAIFGDDGLSLSAFEVTPPNVVAVGEGSTRLDGGGWFSARQVGDGLQVTIDADGPESGTEVGVYDVTGRQVDWLRLEPYQTEARTGPLRSGVYFLCARGRSVHGVARAVIAR